MLVLLSQFKRDRLYGYVWLGTDSWTVSTQLINPDYYPVVKGMLAIVPHTEQDDDFQEYIHDVRVQKSGLRVEDPFLAEYWEKQLNCTFVMTSGLADVRQCDNEEELPSSDPFFEYVPVGSIFDAVETIALGLHDILNCTSTYCSKEYTTSESHLLLKAMNRSSFRGHSGNVIAFTTYGDLATSSWYDIKNLIPSYQNSTFNGQWTTVSEWKHEDLAMFEPTIWSTIDEVGRTDEAPRSFCSSQCSPGERLTNQDTNSCCWNCTKCGGNSYSQTENSDECTQCANNQSANAPKTGCDDFTNYFLEINSLTGILVVVSAIIGLVISLIIFFILIVKKVNGSFLRYGEAIFIASLSCFLTPLLCFIRPATWSCSLVAIIQLLPVTILLTLLMIASYSMYDTRKNMTGKTFLWLGVTIALQMVIVTIWIVTGGPEPQETIVRPEGLVYVKCASSGELPGYFMVLVYQIILDIAGTVFSYSLRMDKANFYEGKFIFSTFVVHVMFWSAVSVTYLILPPDKHARTVLLSQCLTVSGYIFVSSLFVPKLYALKYKSQMLRQCSLSRQRQQWKFKRKHVKSRKVSYMCVKMM